MREGGAIGDLAAVHGEPAPVLGIGSLVRHHDAETADFGVHDRPEGVEGAAVLLDPPVEDVVRRHAVLDRIERRQLVVLEDDLARGVEHEADVEETVFPIRMLRLGLGHDEDVILARELAQRLRLRAGNVDGAGVGEFDVIEIQHLVVEALQAALRNDQEADRNVEARQPGGGLGQVAKVLDVFHDVGAGADAPHGRDQADAIIRRDHGLPPECQEVGS